MKLLFKSLTVFTLTLAFIIVGTNTANAAFNRHRLIDDLLFVDTSSMSVSQIQSFLNARGDLLADWEDEVDIYQVDSRFQVPNDRCLVHKATGMTAAEIIHQAANDWQASYVEWRYQGNVVSKNPAVYNGPVDSCNTVKKYPDINLKTISPKAILATLEKEQSLVSTDGGYSTFASAYYDPACNVSSGSPYYGAGGCKNNNYKLAWAMGYGVPDTGGKRHQYKGFYMQVMYGSWQLRFNYEHSQGTTDWDGTGDWGYGGPKVGQVTTIDGQSVTPQTRATASLYYYTPHIHGNQNFVSIYENWFGATTYNQNVKMTTGISISPGTTTQGQNVTARFVLTNYENFPVYVGSMKIAARDPDGKNVDFTVNSDIVVPANGTYEYAETRTFSKVGQYYLKTANYRDGYGWSTHYPASQGTGISRTYIRNVTPPDVKMTTGISLSPGTSVQGQEVTAKFVLTNSHDFNVSVGSMKIVARDPDGKNVDFPVHSNITVPANSTYTYQETKFFLKTGEYRLWTANYRNGHGWSTDYPKSSHGGIVRVYERTVKEANVKMTTGISISPGTTTQGQNVTARFVLTNYENFPVYVGSMKIAARDPDGKNVDFTVNSDIVVPANGTYEYAETRTFSKVGQYYLKTANYRDGYGWSTHYPASQGTGISRTYIRNVTP